MITAKLFAGYLAWKILKRRYWGKYVQARRRDGEA